MSDSTLTPIRAALMALVVTVAGVTLTATSSADVEAAPSQITVFKHTGSQTPSQYFDPTLNQPTSYTSPADYANGRVFVKLDVLSKPSNRSIIPQLCFWRHTDTQKFKFETCAITRKFAFDSKGTVWIDAGRPADWYKKGGSWDWSKQASLGRIMLKDEATGKLLLTSRCGAACYRGDDITDHVPVKMTAEVIFVARNSQLTPPTAWTAGCPKAWSTACKGSGTTPPPATNPPGTTTPPATTTPGTTPGQNALGVQVVAGDRRLDVSWNNVAGATKYQFRSQIDGRSGWQWDKPTTDRSRQMTGLMSDTTYNIQVRLLTGGKWQNWETVQAATTSAASPTTTTTTTPTTPDDNVLGVQATASGDGLNVTWNKIPGVQLYQFRYQVDGKGGWKWDQPTTDVARALTGLTKATTYNVQVRLLDNRVWQDWESAQGTTAG